jgi:hypothetical protein
VPEQKARDYRRDEQRMRRKRRAERRTARPKHVDATSIVFASQRPDAESRFIELDALPDMSDEWIDKIVHVRGATSGIQDRAYLGVQDFNGTLVWIEITLATLPVPNQGNEEPPAPDPSGFTFIRTYATTNLSLFSSDPICGGIEIDSDGNYLWLSDSGNNRALSLRLSTGERKVQNADPGLKRPAGLCLSIGGNRFYTVRDENGQKVQETKTADGVLTAWLGASLSSNRCDGLCLNLGGTHLYMTDQTANRLRRIRISDGANDDWAITALAFPHGCHVDASGNVWIASGSSSNHRVYKYSATGGTLLQSLGSSSSSGSTADGEFNQPYDVWIDALGRIFVAERWNHRVSVFDSSGVFLDKFGAFGTAASGGLEQPCGIAGYGDMLYVYCGGDGVATKPWVSVWQVTL